MPSNVYVGNVTANVSVHGFMHALQPHYAMPTTASGAPAGTFMSSPAEMAGMQAATMENQVKMNFYEKSVHNLVSRPFPF